jgi:serine/threonine protein kinase/tetratricopeptide (TPR) repeat protein
LRNNIPDILSDRYALRRELGTGGAAIVFEADDLRHNRKVAVKVMRPDLASAITQERFLREIAMVAQLTHPHIVPLFDSGVHGTTMYFVMPLAGDETLRARIDRAGPLSIEEVRALARELCGALTFAHERGVIHRDVKPANILLAPSGAQLTDFGIARADRTGDTSLTTAGYFVGTPAYASPEQLRGEDHLDGSTDQYSLACVLFEALVARAPYVAVGKQDVGSLHLGATVPSAALLRPDVPAAMDAALARAMSKARAERFGDLKEFVTAFAGETTPVSALAVAPLLRSHRNTAMMAAGFAVVAAAGAIAAFGPWGFNAADSRRGPSVAVLPCTNLSGDSAQEYFSDGVTEQLISQLSTLPGLHVINIQSVLRYKGERRPAGEIGRELDADLLVWCSTNRQPEGSRISAQLVDVNTEAVQWSQSFIERGTDVLRPQLDAALEIAQAVNAKLSTSDRARVSRAPTSSDSAYYLYLRGRSAWNVGTLEGLQRSLGLLMAAASEDPQFALAHAGVADAHLSLVGRWMARPSSQYSLASAAVERALAAQPDLGEALAARGRLRHRSEWDWDGAVDDLRRSHLTAPSAWQGWLDHAKLAASQGRHEEAIELAGTSLRLDPVSPLNLLGFAEILYLARRYDEALAAAERAIELEPTFAFNHLWKAMILLGLSRPEEAVVAAREATRLAQRHPGTLAVLARAEAEAGRPNVARGLLIEMDRAAAFAYVPPTLVAIVHLGLGDRDAAMAAFSRAVEERDWFIAELAVHPLADAAHSDPRMPALLARLGLEDVPRPR